MSQKIITGMVVGTAKSDAWSQVATTSVPGGQILMLVTLKYEGEGDALEVAAVGGGVLETLKTTLGVVRVDLLTMKEKVEELWEGLGEELELSVLVVGVDFGTKRMVVAGKGEVELYLKRDSGVARIQGASHELVGIEGESRLEDKFVLCSSPLSKGIGLKALGEMMESAEVIEQVAVLVHGQENSSLMVVMRGEIEEEISSPKVMINKGDKLRIWRQMSERVRGWGKQSMKIRQEQKKHNVMIGVVLLGLLIVGVGVGVIRRSKVVKEREYSQVESVVESKMSEARSIADLNPERAKGLLREARGEVESYQGGVEDENYLRMANVLLLDLDQIEQEVFRQEEVEVATFAELRLLGIEQVGAMTMDQEGTMVLAEKNGTKLVGMNTEDKSSWEVDSLNLGDVKGLGIYKNYGYILGSEGVRQVDLDTKEEKLVIERDELWGEVAELAMFAGNIYVLDSGQGEIWKYPALTEGFGARRRWFGAGIQLDLSKVVNMFVDGDIWIVTSTGKLERYSRGVPVSYNMEGFPAKEAGRLANPKAVFTTDEKVYVLETGAKRVVVFEKESGRYVRQLVNEEFAKGEGMVVVDDKGYVLLSDKIVWFGL